MIDLIKPDLEHIPLLKKYLDHTSFRDCAFCTGNAVLWSGLYNTWFSIIDDMLVFVAGTPEAPTSFTFPISKDYDYVNDIGNIYYLNKVRAVFDQACDYFRKCGAKPVIHCGTPHVYRIIDTWHKGDFEYIPIRDSYDYIYSVEKLSTLAGTKLHGKRNHINKFKKLYPDYSYKCIGTDQVADCLKIAKTWQERHDISQTELAKSHAYEYEIIEMALTHMDTFDMVGGIIYVAGEPAGFTLGERLTADTFDVHFEKCNDDYQGIYPMINKEFVSRELADYTYVNREEDLGLPGLRKSKSSYCPDMLYEKGLIKLL